MAVVRPRRPTIEIEDIADHARENVIVVGFPGQVVRCWMVTDTIRWPRSTIEADPKLP